MLGRLQLFIARTSTPSYSIKTKRKKQIIRFIPTDGSNNVFKKLPFAANCNGNCDWSEEQAQKFDHGLLPLMPHGYNLENRGIDLIRREEPSNLAVPVRLSSQIVAAGSPPHCVIASAGRPGAGPTGPINMLRTGAG
jgi:hypothetical protein